MGNFAHKGHIQGVVVYQRESLLFLCFLGVEYQTSQFFRVLIRTSVVFTRYNIYCIFKQTLGHGKDCFHCNLSKFCKTSTQNISPLSLSHVLPTGRRSKTLQFSFFRGIYLIALVKTNIDSLLEIGKACSVNSHYSYMCVFDSLNLLQPEKSLFLWTMSSEQYLHFQ